MGGEDLKSANGEKHVGHNLTNEEYLINFKEMIRKIAEKTNCVHRTFTCLDAECKSTLFNSQCLSLYGIELIDVSSAQINELQLQWRKSIRYLLNLHPRTHNNLLPHIIGTPTAESQIFSRVMAFISRGIKHQSAFISFFFKNCIVNMHSYMSHNINVILNKTGVSMNEIMNKFESWIKKKCKNVEEPNWRSNIVRELIRCRDGSMSCNLSFEEISSLLNALCID